MAWLAGWNFRKSRTLNGSADGELTNFQKQILNVYKKSGIDDVDNAYCQNHCRDDFGDLRFTQSDGTTGIDYHIEDIQAYFADIGCSSNFYPNISPVAIYNVADDKTYVVFQGTNLHPFITTYNHVTGAWATPVQVGTNPLTSDDHGAPSLLRDAAGYWHVFFGCHATAGIEHVKSNNVDDISAWTAQTDVAATATYPCPVLASDGDIYLFYRKTTSSTNNPEYYIKSTDNGANWGSETLLIDFSSVNNTVYCSNFELDTSGTERIHFTFHYADNLDSWRRNVYHAYLVVTGANDGKCYSMDGTDLGTSITKAEADSNCLVYNSGTNNCSFARHHVLGGVPYIIFPLDNGTTPQNYQFTKWNGLSWDAPDTISAVPSHVRYGGAPNFIILSSSSIEAYLPVLKTGYTVGGDIEKWLWNGATWSKSDVVFPAFEWGGLYNPWVVQNYDPDIKVVFTTLRQGIYDESNVRAYAYGDSGIKSSVNIKAISWLKIPAIPVSPGTVDIYLYYGKSNAITTSNGVNTFLLFDHFLGSSLDAAKWNNNTNVADTLVVSNNEMLWTFPDSGADRQGNIDSKALTFALPFRVEGRWRVKFNGSATGATAVRFTRQAHPTANAHWTAEANYFIGYDCWRGDSANDWLNAVGTNIGATGDNDRTITNNLSIRESLHFKSGAGKQYRNGILEISDANTTTLANPYFGFEYTMGPSLATGTQYIYVDWIALRKHTDNEPVWGAWGGEEPQSVEIQGNIALSLALGSTSIQEYVCQGAVSLALTPQATNIVDYILIGAIPVSLLPEASVTRPTTSYEVTGNIGLSLIPSSVVEYIVQQILGDISVVLTPQATQIADYPCLGAIDLLLLLAALVEYIQPDFSYELIGEKTFPSPSGIYDSEIEVTKTFPAPDGVYPFKPEMLN